MRTENQIFAAFCDVIEHALGDMGVVKDAWPVLARSAQNMTNEDKVVLVDRVYARRKGFQNSKQVVDENGVLHDIWEWIEEYRFQVSCIRQRKQNDGLGTQTAEDIAVLLRAWVDSLDGAEYFREHGKMAPLMVFELQTETYTDDNEVYQKYAHFDVNIQVVQELDRTPPAVDAIALGIRHYENCNDSESGSVDYEDIYRFSSGNSRRKTENGGTM